MLEIIYKGGWMMLPLAVCSLLTLAVIVDRAWAFLANAKVQTRSLRAKVLERLARDEPEEAALLCAETPGPVSAVLLAGLKAYVKHRRVANRAEPLTATMKQAMDDYAHHAIDAVERRLNVLATVATAAPLLGMTGTVTGMIRMFKDIAAKGPEFAGVGIAEALITTATGLIIALVALIPYNIFTSFSNRIDLEIVETTSELLDAVATRGDAD
jgi:biopolymer transport protein ExbB